MNTEPAVRLAQQYRSQIREAQSILNATRPAIDQALASVYNAQLTITPARRAMNAAALVRPVTLPGVPPSPLGFNVSRMLGRVALPALAVPDPLAGLRRDLQQTFSRMWEPLFKGLDSLMPPNLRSLVGHRRLADLVDLAQAEGLSLFHAPRGRIAIRLLDAPDRTSKRRVLGERAEEIVEDCAVVLTSLRSERCPDVVRVATSAAQAMSAGHWEAGQALAGVALDATLTFYVEDEYSNSIRRKTGPLHDSDLSVAATLAMLPVCHAFQHYTANAERRAEIPRTFNRHASAHTASARQFNKRNAVQGLMMVTGLLKYLEIAP